MKKLFFDVTFAALCTALLAACGGDSGSSADSLDESSGSSEMDGAESSDSEDLKPNGSEGNEGESSGSEGGESSGSGEGNSSSSSEEPESSGSEGNEGESSGSEGGESSGSGEGNSSSSSEEPESSGSEGVEGSSASVPGGSSDASTYDVVTGTFTDSRDGQTYRTVKIGDQVWMAENLNFVTDNGWCYNDESDNCAKYGRLYTWAAAVGRAEDECGYGYTCGLGSGDIRGACPKGWHLPSKAEWEALIVAVDGSITEYTSSNTAGTKLKSVTGWGSSGNGTNAFGFSALPAGYRSGDGYYRLEGSYADFWCSAEHGSNDAYVVNLYYGNDFAYLGNNHKFNGFSVRCLKD